MATSQNATHVQPAMIAQIVESVQPAAIAHQEDITTALAKAITESINENPNLFSMNLFRNTITPLVKRKLILFF